MGQYWPLWPVGAREGLGGSQEPWEGPRRGLEAPGQVREKGLRNRSKSMPKTLVFGARPDQPWPRPVQGPPKWVILGSWDPGSGVPNAI